MQRRRNVIRPLALSLGYFAADTLTCVWYGIGNTPMLIHHVFCIAGVGAALLCGRGHLHACWMLVTEVTTPLVTLRWILDKSGMKRTSLYVVNGVTMAITWSIFRVALFPLYFRLLWMSDTRVELERAPIYVDVMYIPIAVLCPACLFVMNLR